LEGVDIRQRAQRGVSSFSWRSRRLRSSANRSGTPWRTTSSYIARNCWPILACVSLSSAPEPPFVDLEPPVCIDELGPFDFPFIVSTLATPLRGPSLKNARY
jgi:hypothetical protein